MRIGIVCYPTFGGSGVVATELGKELAALGHEIHFISYGIPVRLDLFTDNVYYHEVAVSDYPLFDYAPYEQMLTSKLVDVAKYEKLDLFHVHYAIPHASAAYMAREILKAEGINVPFITTLHGTDITLVGKDASFEPVITFSINQSDAVTAVSESLKKDTLQHFGVTNTIEVIPNFICLELYNKDIKGEFKAKYAPNEERILMHISNFRKVKRVEDVVRVFAKVREEIPSKLLLVGDGPERNKIEVLCRELGTCDDISFLGKVKATEKVLAIADLFLLTSEKESFGLAALEAMACSVPVISTNTGGLPEVVEQGVSGFMSNVGDIDDMAKNALRIIREDDQLKIFSENARKQAEKFEVKTILPRYIALYNKVLDN